MARVSVESARNFVARAEIPQPRRRVRRAPTGRAGAAAGDAIDLKLDATKDQAAIVGSTVISFVTGVTTERRDAIINSGLLAQLIAKHKIPDPRLIQEWYDAYFDALSNVGWVIQEKSFQKYRETGANFQTHEAILAVATTFLGAAPAALALVVSTLEALHKMDKDSPWITIFDRESQRAETAHFQISLAQQSPTGEFFVELMAFGLEARSTVTQVLFFKAKASEVDLTHYSGRVTINTAVLDGVGPAIRAKLAALATDYVKGLPDLN
jgi:hypothetical protein